jgi:preprotein translocase SecF subunit
MFNLVQKRRWYFIISLILMVVSVVSMTYSTITLGTPLRLGIDFTSGSILELQFDSAVSLDQVRSAVTDAGFGEATVQTIGDDRTVAIRARDMGIETKEVLRTGLEERFGPADELRFESVGPTIGQETTRAAFLAILAASVVILFFIAIAFRRIPNAMRYGVCATVKVLHDVFFLLGVVSVLGLVAGWEANALFLTAMITVIGFSVEDVIVVFDRIRENTGRRRGEEFETIVNRSLLETLHRSLATQLNAIFIMVAIILFGGVTMREFIAVMLIGMVMGTYSSLFVAVPMLVSWEQGELRRVFKRSSRPGMATR